MLGLLGQRQAGAHNMTIKSVVIPLEVEYLEDAAKRRGVSRTTIVQLVMERFVKDRLVSTILGEDCLQTEKLPSQRYRRFKRS